MEGLSPSQKLPTHAKMANRMVPQRDQTSNQVKDASKLMNEDNSQGFTMWNVKRGAYM